MPGSVKRINQRRARRRLKMIKDSVMRGHQKLRKDETLGTWSEEENKWEIWNLRVYGGRNSKLQMGKGIYVFGPGKQLLCLLFQCGDHESLCQLWWWKTGPDSGEVTLLAPSIGAGSWKGVSGQGTQPWETCAPGCSCQLAAVCFTTGIKVWNSWILIIYKGIKSTCPQQT